MNKKYKFILMLLIVLFAISSYFFIKEIAENKKENNIYEDLQEIVKNEENSIQENDYTNASEDKSDNISTENNTNPDDFYNLEHISKINTDVIGWIKINGTNINYPIMQNENYYLHRNIYKKYSSHGTPYLAEYCNLRTRRYATLKDAAARNLYGQDTVRNYCNHQLDESGMYRTFRWAKEADGREGMD